MNRREMVQKVGTAMGASFATTHPLALSAVPPSAETATHEVLMLVYPRFTALDLVGPHHVLSMLPGYKVRLVWKTREEVSSDSGIPIRPTASFKDCPEAPAVLFVPGGTQGTLAAMDDSEVREFVVTRGSKARFVTSVCTGSLILGAAGLLKGYKATTHWLALENLRQFGAEPVAERVVEDRNRITGAGVTAGIDFALKLAAKIESESFAKSAQLLMEYDPQPPYQSGSPKVADPETVKTIRAMFSPFLKNLDTKAKKLFP